MFPSSTLKMVRERSWYTNWLLAGRLRGRSSSPGGVKNFYSSMSSRPALRFTQPPIQWIPGVLSPGVKLSDREDDHSPPTSPEVKKVKGKAILVTDRGNT
jgi:hypothetical protein